MLIKYRYSINDYYVNPVVKEDLSKDYELETQQRFYRAGLSGGFKLVKDNYDWLNAQAFETEFVFLIEKSNDNGQTWSDYWKGKFYKTDCSWDEDDKIVEFKVDPKDQYTEVLAGIGNEYDLIKLAPALTKIEIKKRPMIQVYIPGQSVIACFFSGNAWEQDVAIEVTDTVELINTYFFSLADTLIKIAVTGTGTPSEIVSEYVGETSSFYGNKAVYKIVSTPVNSYDVEAYAHEKTAADIGSVWMSSIDGYQWQLVGIIDTNNVRVVGYLHVNALNVNGSFSHIRNASNTTSFSFDNRTFSGTASRILYSIQKISDSVIYFTSKNDYLEIGDTDTITFLVDSTSASGTFSGVVTIFEVYSRFVTDAETVLDLNTSPIPSDDIVAYNRNYKRAIGYAIDSTHITAFTQVAPTEYGLASNGEYFVEPYILGGGKMWPIAKSTWGNSSLWFENTIYEELAEVSGRKAYTMKDSVLISDVIKVLLAEIDPAISHEGTSNYSEFLYGAVNPITGIAFRVLITQKSNILAGEYDRLAQKAPITLQSVMAMLRDTFKLYWYIEDDKFKIEHISWFKNGGTYSPSPLYTADLTTLQDTRTKKTWGFASSKYNYDKIDLPERFEFAWMDDVTQGFAGYPIEINSKFVQRGKIDEVNVGGFTSDIDYMLLNPSAINKDGFALMVVENDGGTWRLPFTEETINDADLKMQNGYCSWIYLHPNFWTYDLPAYDVTINKSGYVYIRGIERKKKQKVAYPSIEDPNPLKLIKTGIGDGQIEKISVNLSSRMNEIQLKYDTE